MYIKKCLSTSLQPRATSLINCDTVNSVVMNGALPFLFCLISFHYVVRLESTTSMAVFKGKRFVKVLPLHIELWKCLILCFQDCMGFCFVLSIWALFQYSLWLESAASKYSGLCGWKLPSTYTLELKVLSTLEQLAAEFQYCENLHNQNLRREPRTIKENCVQQLGVG